MPSPHPLLSQGAAGHVLPFCRYRNQSPSVVLVGCSQVFWNSLHPWDMLHPHIHTHLVWVTHQAGHSDRVRQYHFLGPACLTALTARQHAFSFSLLKSAEQAECDSLIHTPLPWPTLMHRPVASCKASPRPAFSHHPVERSGLMGPWLPAAPCLFAGSLSRQAL